MMIFRQEQDVIIRQAKASDVNAMHQLIKENSDQALMLPRSKYTSAVWAKNSEDIRY